MDKIEFSNKLFTHEIHLKKVRALINFASACENFTDHTSVEYLSKWVTEEFLDAEGEQFLDHLLNKYQINYLDWCCLTKWVKRNISANENRKRSFTEFDSETGTFKKIPWKSLLCPKKSVKVRQLNLSL